MARASTALARIKVVGLGNPLLGDDGVGHVVAARVANLARPDIVVDRLSRGGLALAEALAGFPRAILIDAMVTGGAPIGAVIVCRLEDLPNPAAGHTASAHDVTLATAVYACRRLGVAMPQRIDVVAIEARRVNEFGEALSAPVAAAVPKAVAAICRLLEEGQRPQPAAP